MGEFEIFHVDIEDGRDGYVFVRIVLVAFGKLLNVTISFVVTACSPVRPSAWKNSDPTEQMFMKFKITVFSLKCDKNIGNFT